MIKFIINSKSVPGRLKDKTCLLRLDLNVGSSEKHSSLRIKSAVQVLKVLNRARIKTIIISHRGRFGGTGKNRPVSLRSIKPVLEKETGIKIKFLTSFNPHQSNQRLINKIQNAKSRFFLLENLRKFEAEQASSPLLAKKLAELGDFYINDAFAVSHRKDASVYLLPKLLPAFGGPLLKQEISNLTKVLKKPKPPLVIIIGGAKTGDKLAVIKNLIKNANYILLGGGPANTLWKALNHDIGRSIYDRKSIPALKQMLKAGKIIPPIDFNSYRGQNLDLGPKTIGKYKEIIETARSIVWNGPLGYFEKERFAKGSVEIAKAIAKNKQAFSVVGGGETTALLLRLNLTDKISFVSTGGGAMLDFLAGKKLPGIEALKN